MAGIDRSKLVRIGVAFVAGCGIGVAGAHFGLAYIDRLGTADMIGLLVALILGGSGLYTLAIGANAATYQRLGADVEPGERPDAALLRFARRTGVVNLIAGVLFAAPPIAAAMAVEPAAIRLLYAAIVALILVESWVNLRIWVEGDELIRTVVTRSAAICFWLLQGLFFLWAAAERMALVEPVGSWTLLVVLMATYLLVGSAVSVRSGLATR